MNNIKNGSFFKGAKMVLSGHTVGIMLTLEIRKGIEILLVFFYPLAFA